MAGDIEKKRISLLEYYDTIIVFDVETSGLNPRTDQIIELAAKCFQLKDGTLDINDLDCYIQLYDNHRLSESASAVNNITPTLLSEKGITIIEAMNQFITLVSSANPLLIAHNAGFDLAFLLEALSYTGNDILLGKINAIDSLTVFKDRHSYPHKLSDAIVAYHLENNVANSHCALDDTNALAMVLEALSKEKDDLIKYVNLFGYNPKYPPIYRLDFVKYLPQPYEMCAPLYTSR